MTQRTRLPQHDRNPTSGRPPRASGLVTAAPLAPAVRARMESRFGHDFSGVRVHAGPAAAAAADAAGFDAFTRGRHIAFASGRYAPDTPVGARLLAHELTHVVQQARAGAPAGAGATERDADRNAERVAAGAPARVAHAAPAGAVQAKDKDKKKGVGGEASFGRKTEAKKDDEKTTTEAKVSVKVPLVGGGIGPLTLLDDAKMAMKVGETRSALEPDDPSYKAQLDIALTLAKLELLKLSGDFGELKSGFSLGGSAAGKFAPGASAEGAFGSKLTGSIDYLTRGLPYRPYGPEGPLQRGQLSFGLSGSVGTQYATDKGGSFSAGIGARAGYLWPSLHGVVPSVTYSFDVAWSGGFGSEIKPAYVNAIMLGAKF